MLSAPVLNAAPRGGGGGGGGGHHFSGMGGRPGMAGRPGMGAWGGQRWAGGNWRGGNVKLYMAMDSPNRADSQIAKRIFRSVKFLKVGCA